MAKAKVNYKAEGYNTVTPYLTVSNPQKTIDFLTQVVGAQLRFAMKDDDGTIRHAEVQVEDSVIMLGPAGGEFKPTPASLYIYVPDVDATFKKATDFGATSVREPADMFYGDRVGSVNDENGTNWTFGTHVEDVSPEELQRRASNAKAA
jgi:uncharacterized glyoxalase superfamily protein PhnB